jgi:putative spermidine/putrescine transport system permease protein
MNRGTVAATAAAVLVASPAVIGGVYSALAALGLTGAGAQGLSFAAVDRVLMSSQTWRSTAWTLATSGAATAIACASAVFFVLRVRDSRIGRLLIVMPMAVPHVAAALAALVMFSQSGLLSRLATAMGVITQPGEFPPLVYDPIGFSLVVALAWKEFPYLALTALAVLLTGPRDLEEVARTLGATPRQAFWRVTWPRLWRGTAPAALAAFAFLVGQYEMPALLAPSDPLALPLLTYERSVDPDLTRRAEAHVLGLLALAISGILVGTHVLGRAGSERKMG